MKWILETDRIVPDFRDPQLVNTLYELEVLCVKVRDGEGMTRREYFHNIETINSILPMVASICRSLRSVTPLETIETEAELCVR